MMFIFFSVFFFSSRRRHTRWPRDWSSDVCSSDLPNSEWIEGKNPPLRYNHPGHSNYNKNSTYWLVNIRYLRLRTRSEERRVGKEGRSRWERHDEKKKKKREKKRMNKKRIRMDTVT